MGSEARTVSEKNLGEVAVWCGGVIVGEHDALDHSVSNSALNLRTMNGEVERAHIGDMIIRNHDGTFQIRKAY
jgi:hypothetical protein